MHSLPPPTSVPSPAPSPQPTRGPVRLVVGAVAGLAIAGAAVLVLSRGDDSPRVASASTSSIAPADSSDVSTTTATSETPTTAGTVVVPEGALDLGDGVYVPIDATVNVSGTDPFTLDNNNSASTIILQVARRMPGEDPNVLIQEYVDIFDADYNLVSYLPSQTQPPGVAGHGTLRYSSLAYMLYRPDPQHPNVSGEIRLWVRNDGLTILADVYGSSASPISDGAFNAMIESLAAAPSLGETAPWFPAQATLPDTVHHGADLPFNRARRLLLPDGFEVTARSATALTATNNADTVVVSVALGVADRAAAHARAAELLAEGYESVAAGTLVPTGSGALIFDTTTWTGTDARGKAVTGELWVQYDEPSQTVVVVSIAHIAAEWDKNEMMLMVASVAGCGPGAAGQAGGLT